MIRARHLLLVAGAIFVSASVAEAQIYTPSYLSPRSTGDVGLYINDGPGDFSLEGILRTDAGGYDVGFRGGLSTSSNGLIGLVGADLRSPFTAEDIPLEFAFTAGTQALISSNSRIGATVGVSAGSTFVPGDFSVTPYIHPRLLLLGGSGVDGLNADIAADIGVDFHFQPNVSFRLAIPLSTPPFSAWGLGVSWR